MSALEALLARGPGRMVPDLDRIRRLSDLLGHPERAYPVVHVTGTNGKTTTTAMVAALLSSLGLASGAYTSPHLQHVTERIRVAGRRISEEDLERRAAELQPFLDLVDAEGPDDVTYFEALTALAALHFSDVPVDAGVIEVGMGGSWDATNVVEAAVAVILGVAVDHPELGATPEQVAAEKAGIIKAGSVVVTAAQTPAVNDVIAARHAEVGAGRHVSAERDFGVVDRVRAVGGQVLTLRGVTETYEDVYLPLLGAHQAANAAVALAAVEGFLGFAGGIDAHVVREGFAAVRSPGRLEVMPRDGAATVLLDGAHNPAGAAALSAALRSEITFGATVMLLGVLQDKDVAGIVATLLPHADHVVVTAPDTPRAADPERLAELVAGGGVSVEVAADVAEALDRADGVSRPGDGIVVTGSLYTVGEARTSLGLEPQ